MFKIIDNYLEIDEHIKLQTILELETFPWFFNKGKVIGDTNLFHFQFVHIFYLNDNKNSNFFYCVKPLLDKLKPQSLVRIKDNFNPPSHKLIEYRNHFDKNFKCKVAIYYVSDNDGYTMIGKEKIESKANRMVLFNSTKLHYGTNSTNCKNRMVINFNYF